jgi:predicted O-linked N-acetylglucosamine transferase (SPINDLY family)
VLTCSGKTYAARAAGSALTTAGLPELITRDLREYEDRALQLARDPSQLQALRQRLTRQSALFDTRAYCRNLETAYRGMLP